MTSQGSEMTSQESTEPNTPLTPGFDSICFTTDSASDLFPDDSSDNDNTPTAGAAAANRRESNTQSSHHYEPGVIRKMKKSGKYTLNSDVFDTRSRPVSVASMYELDPDSNPAIVIEEDKEEKFDNLHKPVLFLKSCPSPATFLHKKNIPQPAAASPTSLMGKLSLLDSIINDINDTRIQDEVCEKCGFEHHVTEQCLSKELLFEDSDTEVHCNPVFTAAKEEGKKGSGKRKKKKRRRVLKFGQGGDDSSDTAG